MNYNCLLHKEIFCSEPTANNEPAISRSVALETSLFPSKLNLSTGLADTLVERIVGEVNVSNVLNENTIAERAQRQKYTVKSQLVNHEKRCTSGLLISSGTYKLDGTVIGYVKEGKEKEKRKQCEDEIKNRDNYLKLQGEVGKIWNQNKSPEQWVQKELNVMIRWFRRPGDAKLPTTVVLKHERYNAICGRGDPPPPQLSDDLVQPEQLIIPPMPALPGDDLDVAADVIVTSRAAADDDVESVFIDAQEEQEEV